MPPITTVARGRWTSAPARVESAIGTKPTAATSAVVSTGRSTATAPPVTGSPPAASGRSRARTSLAMTTPLSTATPATAMKPTAAGIENGRLAQPQREHAADERERRAGEHRDRVAHVAEHQEQHPEDDAERQRNHEQQAIARAGEVLELAAPVTRTPSGRRTRSAPGAARP